MPEIVRICYHSLLNNNNGHPVYLLTQNNFQDFVNLPDYILEKKAQGLIALAHFSDILRAELLFQYGGMWVDAMILVTRPIQFPDLELFSIKKQTDYEYVSQFRWTGFLFYCKKGNLLFAFLRTFLREYWQKENRLVDYLLLDYGIDMAYDYLPEVKKMLDAIPYNNERVLDLKETCLSYMDFDQASFLRLTEDTQFHKFTNHLKYDTAQLSTYQYLKKKYTQHLLPPSGADLAQKSETEQLEDCLKEIATVLETQAKQIETPGLAHGKTGVTIFFFHYADYMQTSRYEDIACELIEEIVPQLSANYTVDFEDGLTGIGAGIEYLVRQKFVEVDTDESFVSLDSAFSNLIFGNFVSGKHIIAIGKYFLARYNHPGTNRKPFLEQNLHCIIELLDRYTKINSLYQLQILTLLKELSSCCTHSLLPELIGRLTGASADFTEASPPSLHLRQIKSALFSLSRSDIASRYGLSEGYAGLGLNLLSRLNARHASWQILLSPDNYLPMHSFRILMACSPILNNPYVLTLARGIESETYLVDVDKEPFWNPEENIYDIIHIHWPEALFRQWLIPQEEGRMVLKAILQQWKQKGTKIVYTRHDEITHYTRQAEESKKLFDIIESEADALIHLGNYSKETFLKEKSIAGQKHFVIPHHVYDQLYGEQGIAGHTLKGTGACNDSSAEARALLSIPMDKFVILAFGTFRDSEEKQLIRNAFNTLDVPNKYLVAPSWNHVNREDERSDAVFSEGSAFLGDWIVEDEMVPCYFSAADVVFLQRIRTLNSGNLPLGFLFNKTVVGPAIGNMNEYLNNVDNFSFDPTNPASVVSALESACRRVQFPQTNAQYAKAHWRTDSIAEKHRCIYIDYRDETALTNFY
jgi:hypothetical protein